LLYGLRVPWLRVFLRLLSLIFSYSTRLAPSYMCHMLLFVVWHGVYDLLSICSIFSSSSLTFKFSIVFRHVG
jgi:hypothetical protein